MTTDKTSQLERFQRDTSTHQMSVLLRRGLHRHLRFRRADGSYTYGFDIVTWPGFLAISGDNGSYVFTRLPDMFEFFRSSNGGINPGYWEEKVTAADSGSGVKEWDPDAFAYHLEECITWYFEDLDEPQALAECRDKAREEVLAHDHNENEAYSALRDFEFEMPDGSTFRVDDWEYSCKKHTSRFLWCCHAIAWAIQQYDALPVPAESEAA